MSGLLYIGRCAYESKPHTRVDPVAVLEGSAWRVYADWRAALPEEGKVFSPRSLGFTTRELFAFNVQPNERPSTIAKAPDRFVVVSPRRLEQVLDFRGSSTERARRALVEEGLEKIGPGMTCIVVALPGKRCVVLNMVRNTHLGRYFAESPGLEGIAVYDFNDSVFTGDPIEGMRFAIPGITVGAPLGKLDWRPDSEFMESVLKRLHRLSKSSDPFPSTRAQISPIIAYLTRAELWPAAGEDLGLLKERISALAAGLKLNIETAAELVELVCKLTPVDKLLADEIQRRRQELETSFRGELEVRIRKELVAELSAATATRDALLAEASDMTASLETRRQEKQNLENASVALQETLRDEVVELGGGLEGIPISGRERVRELSRRIAVRLSPYGQIVDLEPTDSAPWTRPAMAPTDLHPWSVAADLFASAAKRWKYRFEDLACADILARAGEIVILPRGVAMEFCLCYAAVVASGDVARHVLDPSVIGLNDLWRPPPKSEPTAFALSWTAAVQDPRRYRIVLLDGLERTPLDLWVDGLIEELRTAKRPANLLVFASLGDNLLDPKRMPAGLGDRVIPLMPKKISGLDAEALSRLSGQPPVVSGLDASSVEKPSRSQLLAALEDLAEDGPRLPAMLRWFAAAWPWRSQIDPVSIVRTAQGKLESKRSELERFDALQEGRAWLAGTARPNTVVTEERGA